MDHPNILYLVLDAFRHDAVASTDTIQKLGENNVIFETAVTPATWSLPAHASLLTGEYPHVHGVTQSGDKPRHLQLIETLNERGYSTYGVSGNPFFSQSQGFGDPFDRFWYTPLMYFPEGIDVSNHRDEVSGIVSVFRNGDVGGVRDLFEFCKTLLTTGHRTKSFANVAYAAGVNLELGEHLIDGISHPFFDNSLAYRPEKNTAIIERILKHEGESDSPFFVVANYMDTHEPFYPPKKHLSSEFNIPDSWKHIKQLHDRMDAWEFTNGSVDQETLDMFRELYYGEVRHVDAHLGRLFEALDRFGHSEETIIVLTADHGENLGEVDRRGRKRLGHISSMGEALTRVPLILAHPELSPRTVRRPVSTKDIASSIIDGSLFSSEPILPESLYPEDDVVLCEAPARGGSEELKEKHPNVRDEVIEEEATNNTVLGKCSDWEVILSSTGETWAWHAGRVAETSQVPRELHEKTGQALEALNALEKPDALSESAVQRLRDLGYI